MLLNDKKADICLILEGTYPYIPGGVSNWTHELIKSKSHLSFHIVALLPPNFKAKLRYKVPDNVLSIKKIYLQKLPHGRKKLKGGTDKLFQNIETPLLNIQIKPKLKYLQKIIDSFKEHEGKLGRDILLDSKESWKMILRMYNSTMGDTPFLDYFWTARALLGGIYSVLLAKIPKADVYHALCTGYAGLMLARAHLENNKPCIVTEHGIYTNERRIEISSAQWLDDDKEFNLNIDRNKYEKELRDYWIDSFYGYSNLCYQASEKIITLYQGNQEFQILDGADPNKLMIIPNGIEYEKFNNIKKEENKQPVIALIGRVVPIKDIKTFIRAVAILYNDLKDFKAYIIGPRDEDKEYYSECVEMVHHLKLDDVIEFTGKVNVVDYLGKIDVLALTSISEAQPLVILEAGAAGIPVVATDVGACKEMLYGLDGKDYKIGKSGLISSLSNPREFATDIMQLLVNKDLYKQYSENAIERVYKHYHKSYQNCVYSYLYDKYRWGYF